jgi:pimeloyl-ACP methyl ester carboxylesterase
MRGFSLEITVMTTRQLVSFVVLLLVSAPSLPAEEAAWWPTEADKALSRAGDNRPEILQALRATPADQRKGMAFLVANMPDRDLRSLKAAFLLENLALAYKARKEVPWGARLSDELFLDQVLPYAGVDEARDPWRKEMFELCLPLVKDCKTPGEAAGRLNATLFARVKVRYSTERKKPQQSPKESMESGKASCTGLSILLVDACRSVAVPARVVGTPLWTNKRGNHTWVEVWDDGWHFAGACEPDSRGLDRAWFTGDAAQAQKDSRLHAIYAASFRRTALTFPLVWAPDREDVFAENVTERYARAKPAPSTPEKPLLSVEHLAQIEKAAGDFFAAPEARRATWEFDVGLDQLPPSSEEAARRAVWKAYRAAPLHKDLREDFEKGRVRYKEHVSPYAVKKVGKKPAGGWPLFIAMHGGGNAPKELNDSQWKIMQVYYKDQDSVGGYQYLALRAPNDTWNGFYADYVSPLIVNLIRQFLLFGEVDPDKVYLMGYSHGGYGAFFVGPKVPDRFAAIHSSAAAPTDGTISPKSLRNTRFTFMIGEDDNAYGRRQRCEKFNEAVGKLREQDREGYPVEMEFKKGFGHGGLPDRDKIKDMYPFTRNPVPRRLAWEMTDFLITHFFWLSVPEPARDRSVEAVIGEGNRIAVTTRGVETFGLDLDGRLISYDKPLRVRVDGEEQVVEVRPRLLTLCRSMFERGDPRLAFTCQVTLKAKKR